jgi:hypothetical protein
LDEKNADDRTRKYGALADSLGMEVLVNTDITLRGHSGEIFMEFFGVFTGDYWVSETYYAPLDKTITDFSGKVVYKDGDGTVQIVRVVMFSDGLPGKIQYLTFWFELIGGKAYKREGLTLKEALKRYYPGQKWGIFFRWEGTYEWPDWECDSLGICMDGVKRNEALRREQADNLKKFVQSWKDGDPASSIVPEDMIIPPNALAEFLENK